MNSRFANNTSVVPRRGRRDTGTIFLYASDTYAVAALEGCEFEDNDGQDVLQLGDSEVFSDPVHSVDRRGQPGNETAPLEELPRRGRRALLQSDDASFAALQQVRRQLLALRGRAPCARCPCAPFAGIMRCSATSLRVMHRSIDLVR